MSAMNKLTSQEKANSQSKPPSRRDLLDLLNRAADEIGCTEAGRNSLLLRDMRDALKRAGAR